MAVVLGLKEAEDELRLSFPLSQTESMSLDEYITEFRRLSLGVPELDQRSHALLFTVGLSLSFRSEVMCDHPSTLSDAIQAARLAKMDVNLVSRG